MIVYSYIILAPNMSTRKEETLVTDAEIKENIRIIEIHRMLVRAIGKTIYPESDYIDHDLSKFSTAELIPYTIKFVQKKPDVENPGWAAALEHHLEHNPHHPQYWKGAPMPEEFLKESIVDMIAANFQYSKGKEVLQDHLTADMFEVQDVFLNRYVEADRQKVKAEYERLRKIDWTQIPVAGRNFSPA